VQIWDFRDSPGALAFRRDRSFAAFALGPVGSGKTVPAILRIHDIAAAQAPSPDGIRRTRIAVIRNTMPELRSTTAVTYGQVYPAEHTGDIIWRAPASHRLRHGDIDCEVLFIALDRAPDVKKLLSLELTAAMLNEVREIPRSIVTRLTERVGRFGVAERDTTWSGIWADTNPPDSDHWFYAWHHVDRPEGFTFHVQPPGVIEVENRPGDPVVADPNFPAWAGRTVTAATICGRECPVESIRAAGRRWIVNPAMENARALMRVARDENPLGPRSYYGRALAGKNVDEIRCYLQGVYTFVREGRPCVPEYSADAHSAEHTEVIADAPVLIGADIGGGTLQPSAVFFQRHPQGALVCHREVVCEDLGMDRFGSLLREALAEHFPRHAAEGRAGTGWGDPAGAQRDPIFERASFDYLRNTFGINLRPAPTQDVRMRIAAISAPCERMIAGRPGLTVSRTGCPVLHKGLQGAWHFRRVAVTGDARYTDKPTKTRESHVCDGCGYGFLGAGEFRALSGRERATPIPAFAESDFDPLGRRG